MKTVIKHIGIVIVVLIAVNWLSNQAYKRFDFTLDQRFTLSETSENLIDGVDQPMKITVFLKGELSGEFKRLQRETAYLLEEINLKNRNIQFEFINPVGEKDDAQQVGNAFYQNGMMPENLNVIKNGKLTKTIIFPWAIVKYKGEQLPVRLLNKKLNQSVEEMINASVQNLEYAFADAILKLSRQRSKKIAVLRSNGETEDKYLTDFLTTVSDYYLIAPFSLDSVTSRPVQVLKQLQDFDAIISAKPSEAFTDKEVYVLDQYIMNGGKALWAVETVAIEKDSLKTTGSTIAFPRDLNLLNLFFKYGLRINYDVVNDMYSAPIYLTTGQAENTQVNPYPWFYEPLAEPASSHPIVSNINAVKFEFANTIDTLRNGISKTVLLASSDLSRAEGAPREISLDQINIRPDPEMYPDGDYPLAVLLEGSFTSVYQNRITPFENKDHINKSSATQQIVISDGDILKNDIQKGQALSLGFDRFTGDSYGNKTFLINALNFLLGDEDLVRLRNKRINIPMLDARKVEAEATKWQIINIGLGVVLILVFGVLILWYRKAKLR
jgi:gliding-associated putative ABC transporter substrate-binding component GldG